MGRNAAQAQQQNIIPLHSGAHNHAPVTPAQLPPRLPVQASTIEEYLAEFTRLYPNQEAWCGNDTCQNLRVLTPKGKLSKYCGRVQCAKTASDKRTRSAKVRAKLREDLRESERQVLYARAYADAAADLGAQKNAPAPPDLSPITAAFERIAAALESGALTQMRLPLSDIGQSNDDDAPLPLTPLKPAKGGSSRGKKTTPPANPNNIDLEIKKTTKPGNAGRALILQVWLTSSEKNIELFKDEDLEMVTGHPAFNQDLIKKEIKRRAKLVKADASVSPSPQAEKGQGGEVAPGEIRKIAGADKPLAEPNYDDLEDLL